MLRLIIMVTLIVLCVWALEGDLNTAIVVGESVWKFVKEFENFIATTAALIFLISIFKFIIKPIEYINKYINKFFK